MSPITSSPEPVAARRASSIYEPRGSEDSKLTFVKARGSLIWDTDGREYIDCTAQAWVNNLGANDPRVVEAAVNQLRQITHVRCPDFNSPVLFELGEKLAEISPGRLNRVGYSLHGSLATETAMKLAFRNRPGAKHLLVLQDGYHGRSLGSMAASWPHPGSPFTPIQPRFTRVPHPYPYRPHQGLDPEAESAMCLRLLRDVIEKGVDGEVAGLMMEPIQGNGGHIEFPPCYHSGVREICDEFGLLLIWDEVQTGFGRTGAMFASDYYGVVPDIIAFGKGVAGGFPLAGVLADEDLTGFSAADDAVTFGQFPVSLAAALATIKAIEEDGLCEAARERGEHATARLLEMQRRHPLIGDVRCPGLMVALELVSDREAKTPAPLETTDIYRLGLERGVLFGLSRYAGLGNVIKVKPPLDIPLEQLDRALDVLDEVLSIVESTSASRA
jgi:4-aminobutyrate aminotransferase/4-aminobutyrate aminotransferase/(S)-3-amino-2-methylpropionate transaminase